ncbi:MAG: tryptophanase [Bdellovibrionaceae bacterium]|nr:tryptophanase [Pseudobdellovibrionaceae bacterium]
MKTLIEPYKIKSLEPIYWTNKKDRKDILKKAHLNLFFVSSKNVTIDLLTDSGTGAMSASQWSALMNADESYAGSKSFDIFQETVRNLTGFKHVIPTHQGRSAERILLSQFQSKGGLIVSNMLFDTTRANSEDYGFQVLDLPCKEFFEDESLFPFKGNIDLIALEKALKNKKVTLVILTVTNNSAGAQPVSMENIKETKKICEKYSVPLCLDACRFAENAWFIKQKEEGFKNKTIPEIVRAMFDLAHLCFVSAKKDGLSHIGGFIGVRKESLSESCKARLILEEGFPTYGGLAGRDLEAISIGLKEVLEESYLRYRIDSTAFLHEKLHQAGVPVFNPSGAHAVYIDAKKFLSHLPVSSYPGQALVSSLYEYSGIRTCEIGSVMFGKTLENGKETYHSKELVRLCIPRRLYTQSHLQYVAESIISFKEKESSKVRGIKIIKSPPFLRHFTAHFAWV